MSTQPTSTIETPAPARAKTESRPPLLGGGLQENFSSWIDATVEPTELRLGIEGWAFPDLFDPARLAELTQRFDAYFQARDPEAHDAFEAYRRSRGEGMRAEDISAALLSAAPHVSRFVAELFCMVERTDEDMRRVLARADLWRFKKEFAKKRLFKPTAGKSWAEIAKDTSSELARDAAVAALGPFGLHGYFVATGSEGEELAVAQATLSILEVDDTARKAAKAGGVSWTDELHARIALVRAAMLAVPSVASALHDVLLVAGQSPTDQEDAAVAHVALAAVEAWLNQRRQDAGDKIRTWPTLWVPHNIDHHNLVKLRRPRTDLPELFVGPQDERRARPGFQLTDRRMSERQIDGQVDYCLYCHDRDKDSCSKGMRDAKTKAIKSNPIGVELNGCPLNEKISEMHLMRRDGDSLAALALVCIDNPMLAGTGHRICNDCMKACIFQKQEPVNIPEIETSVLTDVLDLPFGFEVYGFLTRWNPLNIARPHNLPYNGKNVLIVGLGPAGYTLAHHLTSEGFACAAVDGLKVEPLPVELTGDESHCPRPIRNFQKLYVELDERILLGFGGVSEYGITVRWDKNFLTVLYVTLARQRNLRVYGGVRFGGTLDLDDAWKLGFDHVAIAAGAGRPTIIPLKNNLARGIRKASDFLMALQLTGAYKRSAFANLQVRLPAIVIGGGLTAIDTATELIAYYLIQAEKTADRVETLIADRGRSAVEAMFDAEEWEFIGEQLAHAQEIREERANAERDNREPELEGLVDKWGGVALVYRKRVLDSPAYRLNHEEVAKSLEEGVRYIECMSPEEAVLNEQGAVTSVIFERQKLNAEEKWRGTGEKVELPARTVCVAAGTSPNVMYAKEFPGSLVFDKRGQYFQAHKAWVDEESKLRVEPVEDLRTGFFTSFNDGQHAVSFYGDNHPHYAGSVVKAMASAKDAYPSVVALFKSEIDKQTPAEQPQRDQARTTLFERLDNEFLAEVVAINRLTATIIDVIVRAPAAARKFCPGQFYRLQNYEANSQVVDGTRLAMEGIALTGAWVDKEKGLLSLIALEMGVSTRLLSALSVGEKVVLMGPTGTPTEIPERETVLLAGGGLGNAVLFSIAKALRERGVRVVYFAGYKDGADLFKQEEIEVSTDQVIWCTDTGKEITPRRPADRHFRGNIVRAMEAYATKQLGGELVELKTVNRIIAIGSDRMMNAVKDARHGVLASHLNPKHIGIASINSPMQCMMKEVCAQCLQKHVDPETGEETMIFSCYNQDQPIDRVDFTHLQQRLRANTAQEKLANAWLDRILSSRPDIRKV